MRSIDCRPGYRSVHGETTKGGADASVFRSDRLRLVRWHRRHRDEKRRGINIFAVERRKTFGTGLALSLTRAPHRQGYSSPPNDTRLRIGTRELGSSAQLGTGLAAT